MNKPLAYTLVLVLLLTLHGTAMTQEKKEPGQRDVALPENGDAPLPKIDLPEFLITGQETIDLPVTAKSMADEERVFHADSRTPGRKDVAPFTAGKQQMNIAGPTGQMDGKISASFGNYTTPSMDGWFGKNYPGGDILFQAHYGSSNGHVANAQWQKTGLGVHGDYLMPQTSGVTAGGRLNGGIGFSNESYRAYGSANPSQLRTLNEAQVNIGLSSHAAVIGKTDDPIYYSAGISWNRTALDDSLNAAESELGFSGSTTTQWNAFQLRGAGEFKTSGVTMPFPANVEMHSPQWFTLRFSGTTFLTQSLQATVALRQFVYRGNLTTASGRLYPNFEIQYNVSDVATVFANFMPTVERNTFGGFIAINKYLRNAVDLQPSEVPVSLSVGSEISFSDNFSAKAVYSFKTVQKFPVYRELNSAKVWDVMYLPEVRVVTVDVQSSYQISRKNSATLTAALNSSTAKDSSEMLPNIPAYTVGGAYRHSFDGGVQMEAFAEYVAKRWTDFAHSNANAGYVAVGGKGEYKFLENFRAIVQVNNLLNREYFVWDGYVERPLFISLGVTYTW